MGNKDHVTVKLPIQMENDIQKILKSELGYKSRMEFVRDAVRRRIDQVKKDLRDEKLLEEHKDYLETIEKAKH